MKILFVTGRYSYGDPNRGEGYEHQNFLPALRHLAHEVEVLDSLDRTLYPSFIELNRALLKKIEDWQPQIVFYIQVRYEIWTETWDIIRDSGIAATVGWCPDDSWKYSQASRFLASHFDAYVTTYADKIAEYHRDGYNRVMLSQWAADGTRLQPPVPASECDHDVSFVGACYGDRSRFVKALEEAGIKVNCFGHGWPNGPIAGEWIVPVLRSSKIALNFSGSGKLFERFNPDQRQIKARLFEAAGAGGFLLSEWAPGIEQFYDVNQEIDVFRTEAELIEKTRHYLTHPECRDKRARAAYRRTGEEHTYDLRMRQLVEFTMEQHRVMPQGTGMIDWDAFEQAASRHKKGIASTLLRSVMVQACSALFGRTRGLRAARKLVFELSWRVFGKRTYSAGGAPGRLFYHLS